MRCTCQTWACERLRSLWAGCSGIPMTWRASWARAPRWGAGRTWGHGRRRGRWRRCHRGFDSSTPVWSWAHCGEGWALSCCCGPAWQHHSQWIITVILHFIYIAPVPVLKMSSKAQHRVAAHNNYEINNNNNRNSCKIQQHQKSKRKKKKRRKHFCTYRHTNTHMSILNIQSLINTQLKMGKNNTRACLWDTCYYKTVGMERCLVLDSQSATHSKTILVRSQVNVCLTVWAAPHILG